MQHDKHTYYFEKYLRKEMSREEKEAFELKLNNDIDKLNKIPDGFHVKNKKNSTIIFTEQENIGGNYSKLTFN